MRLDLRAYLVTDRPLCLGRDVLDVVMEAVRGGVTIVQLREKHADTGEFVALARRLRELLEPFGVALLVNDRVDVALACGAHGVHVGQSDMDVADVRALMGPGAIVGLSTDTLEQALASEKMAVDYLGVGPVKPTSTKTDTGTPWSAGDFARLAERVSRPFVAIGGVDASNAGAVVEAGAAGVAVVSAICSAHSPREAAAVLLKTVDAAMARRREDAATGQGADAPAPAAAGPRDA